MRTRDKIRICERFLEGEASDFICRTWGKDNGCLNNCNRAEGCQVEAAIREAMNGAKWWRGDGRND